MNFTKKCTKCNTLKPLDEFHKDKNRKDGIFPQCKKCRVEYSKKYNREHKEEKVAYDKNYRQENKEKIRKQKGYQCMYKNKNCSLYLGVVVAERLVRYLFNDVEVMPFGNPKFDFIYNKGKKIDVKATCTQTRKNKTLRWKFHIEYNKMPDYFILVAFDNLTNLNPLHLWMIPGHVLNKKKSRSISQSTLHKWSQWEQDIKDAKICCAEMKVK